MNLQSKKPFNLTQDELSFERVSRIVTCVFDQCSRAIVEYGLHVPETRHTELEPALVQRVTAVGRPVVALACNHHGGTEYVHPGKR